MPTSEEFAYLEFVLEFARLERLRSCAQHCLTPQTPMKIGLDNSLLIDAQTPNQVDQLLLEFELGFLGIAYLITGVDRVTLYFANERIASASTRDFNSEVRLGSIDIGTNAMTTATLDQPIYATQQTSEPARTIEPLRTIDELAASLGAELNRPTEEMKTEIESLNPQGFDYNGLMLVPVSTIDGLVDQLADRIKQRLRVPPNVAPAESNGSAKAATKAKPQTTAKKKAPAKSRAAAPKATAETV